MAQDRNNLETLAGPGKTANLREAVVHGMAWMIGLRWTVKALGFINIFILARLLVPADFGLVSMAMIVVGFLDMWVAFGVDNALIQQKDSSKDDFDTAFTLTILQRGFVAVGLALGAPLAVEYFAQPKLLAVLHVLAAAIFISGFNNIGIVEFRKNLNFRAEFIINIVPRLVQFTVTIVAGYVLKSYWALISGLVTGYVGTLIMSYLVCGYRPRLTLKNIRRLWSFSQWSLVVSMGHFVLHRADEIIVGGNGRAHELGLFNIASEIGQIASTELMAPLNRVLFPAYSKLQSERGRFQAAFLNGFQGIGTVLIPAGIGIAMVSDDLVPIALGKQWLAAIPLLEGMAIYGVIRGLVVVAYPALAANGMIRGNALLVWFQGLITVVAAVYAMQHYGVVGVVCAKIAGVSIGALLVYYFVYRSIGVGPRALCARLARPLLATVGMMVAVSLVRRWLEPGMLRLVAAAFIGGVTYAALLLLIWRSRGRPDGLEAMAWERVVGWADRRKTTG